MRITQVESLMVDLTFIRPFVVWKGSIPSKRHVFVSITTDTGLTGWVRRRHSSTMPRKPRRRPPFHPGCDEQPAVGQGSTRSPDVDGHVRGVRRPSFRQGGD